MFHSISSDRWKWGGGGIAGQVAAEVLDANARHVAAAARGLTQSMSHKGNCLDNAAMELLLRPEIGVLLPWQVRECRGAQERLACTTTSMNASSSI